MRNLIRRIPTKLRLAISFALIAIGVTALAETVGLLPDARALKLRGRLALCESIAIHASQALAKGETTELTQYLASVRDRTPEISSVELVSQDGVVRASSRDEGTPAESIKQAADEIPIPFFEDGQPWGTLEFRFPPLGKNDPSLSSWGRTRAFLAVFCTLAILYYTYLNRMLKFLNPSRVIPGRVRSALDALAEGVVVLDDQKRIALANATFARNVGLPRESLLGQPIDSLPWLQGEHEGGADRPWSENIEIKDDEHWMMRLQGKQQVLDLKVSAALIRDDAGEVRGILASFDDVTLLEEQKHELRRSRESIARQNAELRLLATRDPLTNCHNRRSFFEEFEPHWERALQHRTALGMAIIDIDFFKSINDNHGHQMGDTVLRGTGGLLLELYDDEAIVCRYGGEEFCILFPERDIEATREAGERIRVALSQIDFEGLSVTASIGVSSIEFGAETPQDLIEQADRSLYCAKRTGRNRVVRFDEVPVDMDTSEEVSRTKPTEAAVQARIPQSAVSSLFSALAYRDPETAAHCIRVSNLTAMLSRQNMSLSDSYLAEIGALLHDIGKIGVPDQILLKPGPLTDAEWSVLRMHDRFGVEMVAASFKCDPLSAVIRHHHTPFQGHEDHSGPRGEQIPLGARIVTIADAYDAMVSDRPYRKGRDHEAAVAELRRCAGKQFDPRLVEQFADIPPSLLRREVGTNELLDIESVRCMSETCELLCTAMDANQNDSVRDLTTRLESLALASGATAVAHSTRRLLDQIAEPKPDATRMLAALCRIVDDCRNAYAHVIERRRRMLNANQPGALHVADDLEQTLAAQVEDLRIELSHALAPKNAEPAASRTTDSATP